MLDHIIELIDDMVIGIYRLEFYKLLDQYVELLDQISAMLEAFATRGYQIDLLEELTRLQQAFQDKDYIEIADCLLYEIREDCLELKKIK